MRAAALTRYLALAHGLWSAASMDLLRAWTRRKSDDSESKHAGPARKRKGTRALLVGMFGRPPGLLHRGQRFWPPRPLCLSDVMHSRLLGSFSSQRPANKLAKKVDGRDWQRDTGAGDRAGGEAGGQKPDGVGQCVPRLGHLIWKRQGARSVTRRWKRNQRRGKRGRRFRTLSHNNILRSPPK